MHGKPTNPYICVFMHKYLSWPFPPWKHSNEINLSSLWEWERAQEHLQISWECRERGFSFGDDRIIISIWKFTFSQTSDK